MAQVRLEHVSKIYSKGDVAVKNFCLTVEDGEFLVLVGPSGCGKSTTLRMIAGLEVITDGNIFIGDRLVNNVLPMDRDIAMVFQNYALYPNKTVYDNMAFCLKVGKIKENFDNVSWWERRKLRNAFIDKRVRDVAEILGITDFLNKYPAELSGGQRQRVALGRCIVRNPSVFLFDEPLSNLDAKMRIQMRTEISRLHNRLHSTMIYVTHDQVEAMTMGDRIVVMKDGIIQQISSPAELYACPCNMFVAGFIGTPPMNFFVVDINLNAGILSGNGFSLPVDNKITELLSVYAGKKVILGLRPECFEICNSEQSKPKITATIDVVEPTGSDTILYLNIENKSFVAKVSPEYSFHAGSSVELAVSMEKAVFFDISSERRIAP